MSFLHTLVMSFLDDAWRENRKHTSENVTDFSTCYGWKVYIDYIWPACSPCGIQRRWPAHSSPNPPIRQTSLMPLEKFRITVSLPEDLMQNHTWHTDDESQNNTPFIFPADVFECAVFGLGSLRAEAQSSGRGFNGHVRCSLTDVKCDICASGRH